MRDQFPVLVKPVEGESLLSVADRVAWAHRLPTSDVYAALGLGFAQFVSEKGPIDIDHVAWTLRLDTAAVERCTWTAGVSSRWGANRAARGLGVMRTAKPCGLCVGESGGAWLASWHLAWSEVCVRHGVTLLERCGECGKRYRHQRSGLRHPPDVCGSWAATTAPRPCSGKPENERHLAADASAIQAQAALDRALAAAVADGPAAVDELIMRIAAERSRLGSAVTVGTRIVCRPAPSLAEVLDAGAIG